MTSQYQVFLSHAGEDKETLAIPLYKVLKDRGIEVFLDQPELRVGENAPDNMDQNMETAPIGVFILRPEFLAKKWTMKELFCFQRRVKEAQESGDQPPLLIPVFYGMAVGDCGDTGIFGRTDKNGENVFVKCGFYERVVKDETSVKDVLQAVKNLSKHTGICNDDNINNEKTPEMARKRENLVREIAEKVIEAVQRLSSQHQTMPGLLGLADTYKPYVFVPRLPRHVILDFTTQDEKGIFVTVEGRFKGMLKSTINRNDGKSAAAVGQQSDVFGLTGMGGVGKSVSLIALGYEKDICKEFTDGIYFILLGQQADAEHVVEQLARVVSISGGRHLAKEIREARSVASAVDDAAKWFKGKKVLFLLDDVWESDSNSLGFFEELERLASSEGRIALTTRNKNIAEEAGCAEYFGPREPQGKGSRGMLFEYAGLNSDTAGDGDCDDAVEMILDHCAGLPLALGIAGRTISQYIGECGGDWKGAMSWYAGRVGAGTDGLVHEPLGRYDKTMREAVNTSLCMADKWGQSDRTVGRFGKKFVVSELYHRLSVLRKQARVPLSMLSKLWGLGNMEVDKIVNKLSSLNLLSSLAGKIWIHDLVLDVCVHEAGREGKVESYHKTLLRAYYCRLEKDDSEVVKAVLEGEENVTEVVGSTVENEKDALKPCERSRHSSGAIVRNHNERVVTRAWWKEDLDEDGYLAENLARHLVAGGNTGELRKLLCDARWTSHRVKAGNALAWEGDFAELLSGMEVVGNRIGNGREQEVLKRGLEAIRDNVLLSWPFLMQNPNELAFQVFGRMRGLEENMTVVGEYLESVEVSAKKPWLKPMKRCLHNSGGPLKMSMALKGTICAIAISPTKPRAFIGVNSNIVVVDLGRREVIMELEGHEDRVRCLAISADGLRVVSGSKDNTLRMWDAESGSEVGEAMRGHGGTVTCAAISPDGKWVVSGSIDRTLRVWDMQRRSLIGEALVGHSGGVYCLAITPDGKRVVYGSRDCTLRVWDMQTRTQVGEALVGHRDLVRCVAITPDGKRVISGSLDCTLRVWDMQVMTQVGEFVKGIPAGLVAAAMMPDGNRVISGSFDSILNVWDLETMAEVGEGLEAYCGIIQCLAITPDGKRVMSGAFDQTLRVWDIQAMTQMRHSSDRHSGRVDRVTISPNGKYIVSVSSDRTLVWKKGTGEVMREEVRAHTPDRENSRAQFLNRNVVTYGDGRGEVVRLRHQGLDRVFLSNSDNSPADSVEVDVGISPMISDYDRGTVCLAGPQRQLLANFASIMSCFTFDKRSKTLAIGHIDGIVTVHMLIE